MDAETYKALAYHDSLPNGSSPGEVSFGGEKLRFAGPQGVVTASLEGMRISLGGFNGKQVFLEHDRLPGWRIVVTQQGVLKDPWLAGHPAVAGAAKKTESRRRKLPWPLKIALFLLAGFLLLLGIGLWQLPRLVRKAAENIPLSTEVSFGRSVAAQVLATARESADPAMKSKLEEATRRLLPEAEKSGYTFQFHIIEDSTLNAFAVPGGFIFVHTGLLKAAKRPEQIAGVLAHEMAHVTERHSLRNVLQSLGLSTVVSIAFGGTELGDSTALKASEWLVGQKFSRDFEREADEKGFQTLVNARIDPRGMREFFETMKAEEGRQAGVPPAWISTHPATQERIERLISLENALPAGFAAEPMAGPADGGAKGGPGGAPQ
jgi:Zn-dependent protease with chaperone function